MGGPFLHKEIPCRMAVMIWGGALCSFASILTVFPGVFFMIYTLCYIDCSVYLFLCPHHLGNYGVGHAPLLFITVPVGICLEASIVAHLYLILGAVFVASSREFQSTRWWVSLFRVAILFRQARIGGEKRARSMESDKFLRYFSLVSILFSFGLDRDVVIEPPDFIF